MYENKKILKTSIFLAISITCLMISAVSVDADKIRDAPIIDLTDAEVIEHDPTVGEKGEIVVVHQNNEEPLIIAPSPDLEDIEVNSSDDLVVLPQGAIVDKDTQNTELIIGSEEQNSNKRALSIGIPAILGLILVGLLVIFIRFKSKK